MSVYRIFFTAPRFGFRICLLHRTAGILETTTTYAAKVDVYVKKVVKQIIIWYKGHILSQVIRCGYEGEYYAIYQSG